MTTKNTIEETTVKNNETANELDAVEEFEIEDVEDVEDVDETVEEYATPTVTMANLTDEYNVLKVKVGDGTASPDEEDRFLNIAVELKAQRTGKSIKEVTTAISSGATAIRKDEVEGSLAIAWDAYKAGVGGPHKIAERVARLNDEGFSYIGDYYGNDVIVEAGTVETATGKFSIQWNDTGRYTFDNQRRYYANQLLLLDYFEGIAKETGVIKGKVDGNVVRNENGDVVPNDSTVEYTAKFNAGTAINRTGATVTAVLPHGASLWLNEDYTVDVPGYGNVTVPSFTKLGMRGLYDAKKVATGTFKADNVLRNQGPFKELTLAYPNVSLGYYDGKLGKLPNGHSGGTSYDAILQKVLVMVGAHDNYALAQRIVIKVDGEEDRTIAEFDAKIRALIA
jgi:hypothetical protein